MKLERGHLLKLVIHERGTRRSIKQHIEEKMLNTKNDLNIAKIIISYMSGHCNRCGYEVTTLKTDITYSNICITCYNKVK